MAEVIFMFPNVHMAPWPYQKHEIHIEQVPDFLVKVYIDKSYFHFLKHDFHILQNDFQIDAITPYPFDKHDFHFWKSG